MRTRRRRSWRGGRRMAGGAGGAGVCTSWSEDALVVAAEVWNPCYFTGWTAAQHWALTEQVFRTTVLKTSERVRAATVRLLDHDYLVGHIEPESLSWGLQAD